METRWYQDRLHKCRNDGLYRQLRSVEAGAAPPGRSAMVGDRERIVFCSNNYLALAGDPRIVAAVKDGLDKWGFGSTGSRLICGNTLVHEQLQTRLALKLGKEKCLIFPSGYATNLAVLTTLPQAGDLIAIDKLVHASIIDGARGGEARVRIWPHRNHEKLRRLLDRGGYERAFIVTDSLFSMDGDRAGLTELVEIKNKYNACLVVDEAHAFGCLGPDGLGVAAEAGVLEEVDIFVATFSKALGGAGGFVAGPAVLMDYLVNTARGFIYTTGLPAVNCLAAGAALNIIEQEPACRQRLIENADYFRNRCRKLGLDIGGSDSYIVPIILGSPARTVAVAERLWQSGYWVAAVRPPTVAPGSSRLRISLMSEHTREDIDGLCAALGNILDTD